MSFDLLSYIDMGSASLAIQVFLAGLIGYLASVKRFFPMMWAWIKNRVNKNSSENKSEK